ncbi:hypothetical protein ACIBCA_20810 [Kitasatospora sp. NPDC051170]|uniref:hypothetical protein n=1 Tax=Kitasatospora sp. NPDC051170 TaxID=3364056 RepID=UPI0037B3FA46
MGVRVGQRVGLGVDLGIGEAVAEGVGVVGAVSVGAGVRGVVERVDGVVPEGAEVREYRRLKGLLEDYGHTMPAGSRERLEAEVAGLEAVGAAYRERVTVRVRLDNGLVLEGVDEGVFVVDVGNGAS